MKFNSIPFLLMLLALFYFMAGQRFQKFSVKAFKLWERVQRQQLRISNQEQLIEKKHNLII